MFLCVSLMEPANRPPPGHNHPPTRAQSVIPAAPDAWVWLGDFFYADEPDFDCGGNRNASQCQVRWVLGAAGARRAC